MIFPRITTLIALASILATVAHGISPEELQAKLRETIISPMSHSANGRELELSQTCIDETLELLETYGDQLGDARDSCNTNSCKYDNTVYQALCEGGQVGGQMFTITYEYSSCPDPYNVMVEEDLPNCAGASCDLGEFLAYAKEELREAYCTIDFPTIIEPTSEPTSTSDGFLPAAAAASIAASMTVLLGFLL